MRDLLIARIRHHPGQAEFVMSMSKALNLSREDIVLQIDSNRLWDQLALNSELKNIMVDQFKIIRPPYPFNLIPLTSWIIQSESIFSSKPSAKKIISKAVIFFLKKYIFFNLDRNKYKNLYLVNQPVIDDKLISYQNIFKFSTPISPTLVTYGRFLPGLAVVNKKNVSFIGEFPAASLSLYWTNLLISYRRVKSPNDLNESKDGSVRYLVLADRTPNTDNLTTEETQKALEQISKFISSTVDFKVIYRKHPRFLEHSSKIDIDLVEAVLKDKAVYSSSHLRMIARDSVLMITFGGTACFEGICVGCPVIEVVSKENPRSGVTSACMSPYGLAKGVYVGELAGVINDLLSTDLREQISSNQYDKLEELCPGFENIQETGAKIREALTLIQSSLHPAKHFKK